VTERAIQDLAAPESICYGCGSAHPNGLHIKSYWHEDGVHLVCRHTPDPRFTGWPGLVYGGLLAMLIDCHSNWTAMAAHYRTEGREPDSPPAVTCVTGKMAITYVRPTPMDVELTLLARVEGPVERKTRVLCEVWAAGVLTATGDSVFVRVDTEQLRAQATA
jgi:hypothetical protein